MSQDDDTFTAAEGEVCAWIEQEAIHVRIVSKHGDPVEFTKWEAEQLAEALLKLAKKIE